MWKKFNKYKRVKTEVNGILFDSKLEARRYQELVLLNKSGVIQGLEIQFPMTFFYDGKPVFKYIADFIYIRDGVTVIEDAKGVRTDVFNLKWKLMKAGYPDVVFELWPVKAPKSRKRRSNGSQDLRRRSRKSG